MVLDEAGYPFLIASACCNSHDESQELCVVRFQHEAVFRKETPVATIAILLLPFTKGWFPPRGQTSTLPRVRRGYRVRKQLC